MNPCSYTDNPILITWFLSQDAFLSAKMSAEMLHFCLLVYIVTFSQILSHDLWCVSLAHLLLLFLQYAAQGCGVALAEGVALPLLQSSL